MSADAGATSLAKDVFILADPQPMLLASLLWLYKNRGSIAGVPVLDSSKDLAFLKQSLMIKAMLPVCDVLIFIGYLSPLHKDDVEKYKHIKQLAALGSVIITLLQKQFVADKKAYMCLVVYGMYRYKLNLRYNFYKEDFLNGKE